MNIKAWLIHKLGGLTASEAGKLQWELDSTTMALKAHRKQIRTYKAQSETPELCVGAKDWNDIREQTLHQLFTAMKNDSAIEVRWLYDAEKRLHYCRAEVRLLK